MTTMRSLLARTFAGACLVGSALPAEAETLMLDDSTVVVEEKLKVSTYWLGYGFGALWTSWRNGLQKIDPTDNSVTLFPIEGFSGKNRGIAVGEGAVWVPDAFRNTIFKIDPASGDVLLTISVLMTQFYEGTIGVGAGSVWVTTPIEGQSWLIRFSAETGAEEARIGMPTAGWSVEVGHGSVWVTTNQEDTVYRVDPATNAIVASIAIPGKPRQIAAGANGVWVVAQDTGVIHRIDPNTNVVVATFETGIDAEARGDIFVGGGYVWATFRRAPLVQIDPATNTLLRLYQGNDLPGDSIRYGGGSLWVAGWGPTDLYRLRPPEWWHD